MTTEQLAALKEVAEAARDLGRSDVPEREYVNVLNRFKLKFNPTTCAELVEEVERLRDLCRSALAIARREGKTTSWAAFLSQLERAFQAGNEEGQL